jgi:hypothetical protein
MFADTPFTDDMLAALASAYAARPGTAAAAQASSNAAGAAVRVRSRQKEPFASELSPEAPAAPTHSPAQPSNPSSQTPTPAAAYEQVNYARFLAKLYAKLGRAGGHAGGRGESLADDAPGGGAFGDGVGAHFAGSEPLSPAASPSAKSPRSFADLQAGGTNGGSFLSVGAEWAADNWSSQNSPPPRVRE